MKLSFLVSQGRIGGGAFYIYRLAEYLARRGHEVALELDREPPPIWDQARWPDGLRVHTRPRVPFLMKGFGLLDRMVAASYDRLVLRRRLVTGGVQCILGQQTEDAIRAHGLARRLGLPLVTAVFETPDWLAERLGDRWTGQWRTQRRLRAVWEGFAESVRASDLVLTISQSTAARVQTWLDLAPERLIVAYPGLDAPEPGAGVPHEAREAGRILYVGRMVPSKNLDLLLKAAASMSPRPRLLFLGDGPLRPGLVRLASELRLDASFPGEVDEGTKWRELARARCLAFPTSFEGFGIPPGEALVCGTPCVATDIPILREVYGEHLIYFREGDAQDLADKLGSVLARPGDFQERTRAGRDYVLGRYTWERAAATVEAALAGLL